VQAITPPTYICVNIGRRNGNKLRARIAAAPASGRAALEAKLQRTYSPFHTMTKEKLPPAPD
jgi:hypothetical protein